MVAVGIIYAKGNRVSGANPLAPKCAANIASTDNSYRQFSCHHSVFSFNDYHAAVKLHHLSSSKPLFWKPSSLEPGRKEKCTGASVPVLPLRGSTRSAA